MFKKFGLSLLLVAFLSLGFSQLTMASSTDIDPQQLCMEFCEEVYDRCMRSEDNRTICMWEQTACWGLCHGT